MKDGKAFLLLQVECDAPFAPIADDMQSGLADAITPDIAAPVTLRRLDLDNIRTVKAPAIPHN